MHSTLIAPIWNPGNICQLCHHHYICSVTSCNLGFRQNYITRKLVKYYFRENQNSSSDSHENWRFLFTVKIRKCFFRLNSNATVQYRLQGFDVKRGIWERSCDTVSRGGRTCYINIRRVEKIGPWATSFPGYIP